jgi:hypothetical protein
MKTYMCSWFKFLDAITKKLYGSVTNSSAHMEQTGLILIIFGRTQYHRLLNDTF